MAKSKNRDIISMECTVCKRRNYSTMKNKKNNTERLILSKYCQFDKRHTEHKEVKQARSSIGRASVSKTECWGFESLRACFLMKQINSIKSFFQKLWIELTQKVTWPSRKVMIESTIIILSFILIWASLIGAIDFVFATGLSKFLDFVNPV